MDDVLHRAVDQNEVGAARWIGYRSGPVEEVLPS